MTSPATEEKQDVMIRMLANIQKRLDKMECKTDIWVNKKEAMKITGYGATKLNDEVKAGRIPTNANPKKGRQLLYNVIKFVK